VDGSTASEAKRQHMVEALHAIDVVSAIQFCNLHAWALCVRYTSTSMCDAYG